MPYFPTEEYIDVDLGNGQGIRLFLKSVDHALRRKIATSWSRLETLAGRIENLQARAKDPAVSLTQYEKLQGEIDQLNEKGGESDIYIPAICAYGDRWDYYATKADYEAKRPIPINEEALKSQADPVILKRVFKAIVEHATRMAEQGEAQGANSPAPSPSTSDSPAPSPSPSGILTTSVTAPSQSGSIAAS